MNAFFTSELEGVATFWRIFRKDGVALGFSTHDRDLRFEGLLHRSAPGLVPSAIRKTNALEHDSAEVSGALSHDSISEAELAAGHYDQARIEIGAVNWETLESMTLYSGEIGELSENGSAFEAELRSVKARLEEDLVPRTSPTCRAEFCGKDCGLSANAYTTIVSVTSADSDTNTVAIELPNPADHVDGRLRFLEGPQTGLEFGIMQADAAGCLLDRPLATPLDSPLAAELREGCDHTIETCTSRFGNAANFRGEPFLPGNDLLARYPVQD
jgi:uncharacterized phage protein (TIGR02218 family)